METKTLDNDITVLYVTAGIFPAGVMAAFKKLGDLVPDMAERKVFGLSRPENGAIRYRAAVEEKFAGQAAQLGCGTITLKSGKYVCETITGYMDKLPAIGDTFKRLIALPGIDPEGYCVEWYSGRTAVCCMVRLAE
ncbi:MAG TPA: hypothetical protein VHB48_18310 [Chitinophagaceae bacterium]|jgi:hypothetical protein|nr:hypothetical protein [Chitinophagaceae bacterium]